MGVQPIASIGEIFDPHIHEAVAIDESGKFPPNTVTGELLRGYRIGDKIIRAAMVKVAPVTRASANVSSPESNPDLMDNFLETE